MKQHPCVCNIIGENFFMKDPLPNQTHRLLNRTTIPNQAQTIGLTNDNAADGCSLLSGAPFSDKAILPPTVQRGGYCVRGYLTCRLQTGKEDSSMKDTIIIHCSATRAGQDFTAADIDRWHRQRGFRSIGYHFVVRLDGTIEPGRDVALDGAHCTGWNHRSIGICYIGGLDKNGRPADTNGSAA